jgi:guanylate kinase
MLMAPMADRVRKGLMIVLSSPSGAGKSTLTRRLLASDAAFTLSISATTRPPRDGEVEGRDYYFVDRPRFDRMIEEDALLEHAEVFGNRYGTPEAPVAEALGQGRDVLFDVDWQGAQQLRASTLRTSLVTIFILPPSIAELERRLRARAQDDEATIERRMAKARDEISHWAEYDYVLVNDDLDACFVQVATVIAAERLRFPRQPGLGTHVERLNREFDAARAAPG